MVCGPITPPLTLFTSLKNRKIKSKTAKKNWEIESFKNLRANQSLIEIK